MESTKQVKIERSRATRKTPAPIVLVGFMGCGKSTLGCELARGLGLRFVDLDEEIVRATGRSIPAIFQRGGEDAFRKREARALRRVLKPGVVLATGGGLVMRPENCRQLVFCRALVVWIDPSWKLLWARLKDKRTGARPLLVDAKTGKPRSERSVRLLWSLRRGVYGRVAETRLVVRRDEKPSTTASRLTTRLGL